MTNLLIKLFVRDAHQVENKRVRERYGSMTSVVGIIVNFLLFAGKFLIGTLSGSVAISADAINNLSESQEIKSCTEPMFVCHNNCHKPARTMKNNRPAPSIRFIICLSISINQKRPIIKKR